MATAYSQTTGLPDLSDDARKLLRVILERKLVRGGELMKSRGFSSPEQLVAPIKELLDLRLVEVSGLESDADPTALLYATFGTQPSSEPYLRKLASW